MTTRLLFLAFSLALVPASAAAPCAPPEAAVRKLQAYFSYSNGQGVDVPGREPFSVLQLRNRVYFRQNNLPQHGDPNSRPVYVDEPDRGISAITCPAGPRWVNCVAEWAENPHKDEGKVVYGNEPPPSYTWPAPKERPCEFTMEVPAWRPSPDSPRKRAVAAEIRQEIQAVQGPGLRAIYLRDFNLDDPEIEAYILYSNEEPTFRGCSFDVARRPHCLWHGFGQAPLDALRRGIMSRPYRLFPPPAGRR